MDSSQCRQQAAFACSQRPNIQCRPSALVTATLGCKRLCACASRQDAHPPRSTSNGYLMWRSSWRRRSMLPNTSPVAIFTGPRRCYAKAMLSTRQRPDVLSPGIGLQALLARLKTTDARAELTRARVHRS